MQAVKKDAIKAAGCRQLCTGQKAGSEAAIHGMHEMFDDNKTEKILLVDAENAYKTISRKVLLHNTEYLYPELATFTYNC